MSTLQVANVHLESTGNNRIQYAGSNSFNIVAGGSNTLTVNSSAVVVNGALTAGSLSAAAGALGSSGTGKLTAYTANGTWSNAAPNLKAVKVTVVGGGGGSGRGQTGPAGNPNAPQSPDSTYGGSGGGGGFSVGVYPVAANPALLAPVTVTVGNAGIYVSPGSPTAGGTSSFGSLISATGGGAGTNAPSSSTSGTNGTGGSGIGGNWNVEGRAGINDGQNGDIISQGGQPFLTYSGSQTLTPTPAGGYDGGAGFIYGGGGQGGRRGNGNTGAIGIVLVEEFY